MTREGRRRWRLIAICVGSILFGLVRRAAAHDPFEVTTAATLGAESLTLVVTMTRSSALLVSGIEDGARAFTPERFAHHEPQLRAAAGQLYKVISNGAELEPRDARVSLNPEHEVEFTIAYPRPLPGALELHATCLGLLSEGHGNAVRLERGQPEALIALEFLNASDPVLEVQLPSGQPANATAPMKAPPMPRLRWVELGLSHILQGYDHLLFLGGLLLGCRRMKSMLGLITCFTLAHSLTLAFAVLDRVPPLVSAWVEPLILASVVFVGVQNVTLRGEPKYRYPLTFGFGLIHGLGFASALSELGPADGDASIVATLLSFNLGVELGQMLIAAIALPVLLELRKSSRGPAITRALSVAITSIGAYWLTTGTLAWL